MPSVLSSMFLLSRLLLTALTFWVITGTTLGMMIANVPVVFAGRWVMDRLPLKYARWGAFALFLAMALITLGTAMSG